MIKNKLVRDKIPEIIEDEGYNVSYRVLKDDDEYLIAIGEKLREKVEELIITSSVENIADINELIVAYGSLLGYTRYDLREIAEKKNELKGMFKERIFLESFEKK